MIDLLALAERAANNEERAAVLVLEDALEQADWLTPSNAEKVYDVLFEGWPPPRDPINSYLDAEASRDWFRNGFASAEICESALSLFGRKFLASIVTVLRDQCSDSARAK